MKYKVGDKFIVEILGVDSNLSSPYETALSRFTECQLRCIPQLVNGVDTDGYNEGAADAWKIAGLICKSIDYGGFSARELNEIFNTSSISKVLEMPYKEVKDKIEEWKKAKEEIKAGDIVYANKDKNFNAIVLGVTGEVCHLLWFDGSCGKWDKSDLTKTGENHADKVSDIISCISK